MNDKLVAEAAADRVRNARPQAVNAAGGALVIDDDEFVCRAVAAQLRGVGATPVATVADGLEAARLLNQGGPYQLIVSDLSMPTFDGIQMMRLIAARQPQAAVLLMSSAGSRLLSSAEALARGRGLRVMGALAKPLQLDDLRRVMKELVQPPAAVKASLAPAAPDAAELREAFNGEQIRVYVQPQIDVQTGELHGVEALARWDSPRRGLVPPACFIPLAERHGLIDALTESMLAKSLAACGAWRKAGLVTRISVNTPISSMCSLVLPDTIVALAERRGLAPQQLTLEITESGFMEDPVRALDVLTRLRLRGVDLAIDDFGCGYSSLQQLKQMPFNELKIDCSFVMAMLRDPESRSIVKSSIQLCRELGMRSVAEGVESRAHWDALRELGCDVLQGYHVSRPFPVEQFPAWCSRHAASFRR
jgi:EAL domain-containing protein (putative c-di-GMP-specific phosphodiesterase class I)/FixJ family two-component response regulator